MCHIPVRQKDWCLVIKSSNIRSVTYYHVDTFLNNFLLDTVERMMIYHGPVLPTYLCNIHRYQYETNVTIDTVRVPCVIELDVLILYITFLWSLYRKLVRSFCDCTLQYITLLYINLISIQMCQIQRMCSINMAPIHPCKFWLPKTVLRKQSCKTNIGEIETRSFCKWK